MDIQVFESGELVASALYIVFSGDTTNPAGGACDNPQVYTSLEAAIDSAKFNVAGPYQWSHVARLADGELTIMWPTKEG